MGLIAIGDIHGCARTLDLLLDALNPSADDELIFIGDYVDRGPDSMGVIERLIALAETQPCVFLRGNHEDLMLGWIDHGDYDVWALNGGTTTMHSYVAGRTDTQSVLGPGGQGLPETHVRFLRETRLYHDTPEFFFVHAGLKPHFTIAENLERYDDDVFLWERSHLGARSLAWEKPVVCGHTPVEEPVNQEKLIVIDTGCVYQGHPGRGRLTAVRLPERTFVSVDCAD